MDLHRSKILKISAHINPGGGYSSISLASRIFVSNIDDFTARNCVESTCSPVGAMRATDITDLNKHKGTESRRIPVLQ